MAKQTARMVNGPGPNGQASKFWNVASVSEDEGELTLYGEIVSRQPVDWWTGEELPGLFITPEGFLEDLEQVKSKRNLKIKLNSVGGDLYTGIAIHNALKGLDNHKTVIVDGLAASAASVIMCAGDTVQVYPGSLVMIHGVTGYYEGGMRLEDLKRAAKSLDAAERAVAEIYAGKSGQSVESLRAMMSKETWMTGQEAIDKGFADALLEDGEEPQMSLIAGSDTLMVNGLRLNVKGLHLPDHIPTTRPTGRAAKKPKPEPVKNQGGRIMATTIEELRNECPELAKQLAASAAEEAIMAERQRLQEIDDIAPAIGDQEAIKAAKYGPNACDAKELTYRVMQSTAKAGKQFLADMTADYQASGALGVAAVPNAGLQQGDTAQEIGNLLQLYNQTKGGK